MEESSEAVWKKLDEVTAATSALMAAEFEELKLKITHFDRLTVVNGAALALSFSGAATVRSLHTSGIQVPHHWVLLGSWAAFIVSIVLALYHNFIALKLWALISTAYAASQLHAKQLPFHAAVKKVNEQSAAMYMDQITNALENAAPARFDRDRKILSSARYVCATYAQLLTATGFLGLAVFFSLNL